MNSNRRSFLQKVLLGGALTLPIPNWTRAQTFLSGPMEDTLLQNGEVILFQGDSITDANRDRNNEQPNDSYALGRGYAYLAAASLLKSQPNLDIKVYNRGVSGNKVHQLAERWDKECLQLQPTILSILIGVNDFWHTLTHNYDGTIQVYLDDYRKLLDRTLSELPNLKLIIGEPFAINGVKAVTDEWYPAFDRYREATHLIATEYQAVFIPYQRIFDDAAKLTGDASYWTYDGVHTSLAGAQLMATTWLESLKSQRR